MSHFSRWFKEQAPLLGGFLSTMSGGVAVVLSVVALVLDWSAGKGIAMCAIGAAWITIYGMSRKISQMQIQLQHQKAEIEEKLQPKFSITCGPHLPACRVVTAFGSLGRVAFLRAIVEAQSVEPILNCTGHLISVTKDGTARMDHETRQLTFAPGDDADSLAKTIRPTVPYHLDVLGLLESNIVIVATKNREPLLNAAHEPVVREPGQYLLTVVLSGDNTTSLKVDLRLNWTGDWATANLSL